MPELTTTMLEGLPKNGPTDPIEYYRKPLVGWLFRERINRGFALLPRRRFARALEVGYGAGAVLLAMAPAAAELHGIDLDADPASVGELLAQKRVEAELVKGSVYELPYPDEHFDLVVCFSVFEHLREYEKGLREIARVLQPGGLFLLGMPSVNKAMEAAFLAIGYKGIEDHHVTTPASVAARFVDAGLRVVGKAGLDLPLRAPFGMRLYHDWLLEKAGR
jgi:2-polyprenyl-3-methyl-5-hydroxy-6-metoxy-1,4-benzoquinol methylase